MLSYEPEHGVVAYAKSWPAEERTWSKTSPSVAFPKGSFMWPQAPSYEP